MINKDYVQIDLQNKLPQQNNTPDFMIILTLILKNWYWFIITIGIALFCVRFYVSHTLAVYQTTATILINETEDRPIVDNSELLQGLGLPGGMRNLQNQIMILKSRELTESTLKVLPFDVEFYFKTIRNKLPIYPEVPLRIVSDGEIPLPKDIEFCLSFLGENRFSVESSSQVFPFKTTAAFGDTINFNNSSFWINCRNEAWLNANKNRELYFIIHSRANLVNYFSRRINVEQVSREGSVLRVSLEGTNRAKDADFLNEQLLGFQAISLNRKNAEAQRRIQFIEDQLIGVSDSLTTTETLLQQFRSSHQVMDISAQGQAIIGQVELLQNEKARLDLEASYYDYLAEYLTNNEAGELPIVPITMGITDPGLTRLVDELAELQGQLSTTGAGQMNPLQRNLQQRIRTTKDALQETLNGLRRANSLARSENQEQINRANAQASALPVTERQLLGYERKFRLSDELYTYLLETRAQQEMQKASNRADSEIIDRADTRFSVLVSPNRSMLNLIALFAGFGIPLIVIYLSILFNKKLKDDDIKRLTDLPVVGYIPHSVDKKNLIVFENPNSVLAEAFRLMRSRMQFFTKQAVSSVVLITSSMPNEGKTFTSINLASVYSLLDKKIVLLDFDLRKPRIYRELKLKNDKGLSTWLIGKDNLDDIVQETAFNNLSFISAGPIPPNPSELTALDRSGELVKLLKQKYDYIIIDSPPMGVVSDTFHLATLADACLIVVRPGQSMRDLLDHTLNEIKESNIKGVSLVINDIKQDSKYYGYGEKYGYVSNNKRKKSFFSEIRRKRTKEQ
jgi:capsular exopolysaccharide synthesis family protein